MKILIGLGNPGTEYESTRHNAGFLFVDFIYTNAEKIIKPWKFDKYLNANIAEIHLQRSATHLLSNSANRHCEECSDEAISGPKRSAAQPNNKIQELTSTTYHLKPITLLKPMTFMNRSGEAIIKYLSRTNPSPNTHHPTPINHNPKPTIYNDVIVAHDDLDLRLGNFKIQFGNGPKMHNGISSVEKSLGTTEFWRIRIGIDNRTDGIHIPGETYVLSNFTYDERKSLFALMPTLTNTLLARLSERK